MTFWSKDMRLIFFFLLFLWQEEKVGEGSICNKAIMIITDGAPENYVDVYSRSNWPEKAVSQNILDIVLAV